MSMTLPAHCSPPGEHWLCLARMPTLERNMSNLSHLYANHLDVNQKGEQTRPP